MDFPDPYLWHVTGLKPGQQLPVLSGAGPNFRIIHALTEGTPVDMQNCMESRGGYWCRIATVDRPRISGWVDGRYVLKTGGDPPGMIGGVPVDPVIELPVGKGQGVKAKEAKARADKVPAGRTMAAAMPIRSAIAKAGRAAIAMSEVLL